MTEPLTLKSSQLPPPAHCHVEAPPGCCEFTLKTAEGCAPYLSCAETPQPIHTTGDWLIIAAIVFGALVLIMLAASFASYVTERQIMREPMELRYGFGRRFTHTNPPPKTDPPKGAKDD